MRQHNFQTSLAKGKAGEALILKLWPELMATDGRKGDFLLGADKLKVEVKSDSYGLHGSPNFFFERYSNASKGSPGGPWQALAHGCNLFVYFYPSDRVAFIFDTVIVVNLLNQLITSLQPVEVQNRGYTTIGFKVPRSELEGLYILQKFAGSHGA